MSVHTPVEQVSGDVEAIINSDDNTFLSKFPGLKEAIGNAPSPTEVQSEDDEEVEEVLGAVEDEEEEEEEAVEKLGDDNEDDEDEDKEVEKPAADKDEKPVEEKKEDKAPADFEVFDEEGELDQEGIKTLKFKFKAQGKLREVDGGKLVRLAKMGYHNEQLLEEVDAARTSKTQYEAAIQAEKERNDELVAYARKILADDEFLIKQREEYEKANTPEAKLQREREELKQERAELAQQEFARAANNFVMKLDGALSQLHEKYNKFVTDDEVRGRADRLIAPLKKNGVVPREHWSEVERIVTEDLTNWMAGLAEERSERASSEKKEIEEEKKKAKDETRAAKRKFARALRPVATSPKAGTGSSEQPKKKAPSTRDEAEFSILQRVVKQVREAS